jgi:hypothetical protein
MIEQTVEPLSDALSVAGRDAAQAAQTALWIGESIARRRAGATEQDRSLLEAVEGRAGRHRRDHDTELGRAVDDPSTARDERAERLAAATRQQGLERGDRQLAPRRAPVTAAAAFPARPAPVATSTRPPAVAAPRPAPVPAPRRTR